MRDGKYIKKTCSRFNISGHAHELTFSCYKGQNFLAKDLARNYLSESIVTAGVKHNFDVWAYVFMPNHVHLLIYPRNDIYEISQILLSIKQPVSRRAILYLKENNPNKLKLLAAGQKKSPYRFWQAGGGYDRNLEIEKDLINVVDYIHRNPIRKRLVKNPEDWKWSSYRDWYGYEPGVIPVNKESFPVIDQSL
jgi:REP-associated tyrosine transposase